MKDVSYGMHRIAYAAYAGLAFISRLGAPVLLSRCMVAVGILLATALLAMFIGMGLTGLNTAYGDAANPTR